MGSAAGGAWAADRARAARRLLITLSERDPEAQARLAAFREGLRKLGWTEGRNLRIEYRLSAGDAERRRAYAADLVAMTPDVIVAGNSTALIALREATRSVPMVFVQVTDPIGNGYVTSLSRPGGNITGFALSLHPEKTRLIEFGRFAADRRQRRELGRPETFNLLGFTSSAARPARGNSKSNGGPDGTACERSSR